MVTQLKHLRKTYRQLRLIAGGTLILVPLLIIAVAYELKPTILPTLSHYYFAEPNPGIVRTLFTGFLILVGGVLIAYRGFDDFDHWIHNAAGIFAVGVAIFPKDCDMNYESVCAPRLLSPLHLPSAILVFVCAALAVLYCGGKKFKKQLKEDELRTLRLARIFSITLMSLGIALYAAWKFPSTHIQEFKIVVLLVELFGFFGFAIHWLVMTRVINRANRRIRNELRGGQGEFVVVANLVSEGLQPSQAGFTSSDEEELFEIP